MPQQEPTAFENLWAYNSIPILKISDSIYWHPNRAIPGVEFHSGSLGYLLAVSVGSALGMKMCKASNRVFVVTGDGELDEGSVWEAALVAAAKKLDNLIAIVDRNEFQANFRTEDLIPLEPIGKKFDAFGWSTLRIDGHDFEQMEEAFARLPIVEGKPLAIIADTVRGKGLPSIERRADRWFVNFTGNEVGMLLRELHGSASAELTCDPIMKR